jgi:hypothetical protein
VLPPAWRTAAVAEAMKAAISDMSGSGRSGWSSSSSHFTVKSTGPSVIVCSGDSTSSSSLRERLSSSGRVRVGAEFFLLFFRKWNFGEFFRFELPDCWLPGLQH